MAENFDRQNEASRASKNSHTVLEISFSKGHMSVRKIDLFKSFLLTLLAVQLGCSTHVPVTARAPQIEPEKAVEPSRDEAVVTRPEADRLEQQAEVPQTPSISEPKLSEAPTFPESVLSAPETEAASAAVKYDTLLMTRSLNPTIKSAWQYRLSRDKKIIGFEFSNRGGNAILPGRYDIEQNRLFTRDFEFRFEDRARQDIHLLLTDWAPSRDKQFKLSEMMHSVMLFFPRRYLPAVAHSGEHYIVTLPTGEEVEFDATTREVRGGVFSEAPVDLNPDKAVRKYPGINYTGRGVVVRANARGVDPRIGTVALITTGSPAANCEPGSGCNQCQVPSKELWQQSGSVRFKFSTDEEFDRYLMARCGFGLPKNGLDFVVTSPRA